MGKFEYMKNTFGSTLKPRARLVLQCLVYHADREGSCFPALKTIAVECGYSLSTVKRALRELCEAGYIIKQERFEERKNGGQTSNLYILAVVSQNEPDANTPSESTGYPQEAPSPETVLSWEPCAHMFTDSFSDDMKCVFVPLASAASSAWPGRRSFLYPLEQYR